MGNKGGATSPLDNFRLKPARVNRKASVNCRPENSFICVGVSNTENIIRPIKSLNFVRTRSTGAAEVGVLGRHDIRPDRTMISSYPSWDSITRLHKYILSLTCLSTGIPTPPPSHLRYVVVVTSSISRARAAARLPAAVCNFIRISNSTAVAGTSQFKRSLRHFHVYRSSCCSLSLSLEERRCSWLVQWTPS